MPLDIINFFRSDRLFNLRPAIDPNTAKFLLIIFGVLILAGLILLFISRKKSEQFLKRLLNKYSSLGLVTGVIGGLLVWFRYERASFFSARFWLVVWALGFMIWLAQILRYQLKAAPEAKKKMEQRKIFNQYLPKKK